MKTRRLALRVTLHSFCMILGVYFLMQVLSYFRDNLILGISDLDTLAASVWAFLSGSVLPPLLLFSAVVFLLALPIQRVQRRLEAGEVLDSAVLEKTRRRLLAFSLYILAINLIGFTLGFVLSLVLTNRVGDLLKIEGLVILVSNLSGGIVYATAQSALNNLAFADLRERLGIREIGSRKKEMRSTVRQVFLTGFLVLYTVTFLQFQGHDLQTAQALGTKVLAEVEAGKLSVDQAGTEYRKLLGDQLYTFSSRAGLDVSKVPLPWEKTDSYADVQQVIFLIFFVFIFVIALGIQAASSTDLRDQILALQRRIRDVVAGGGDLTRRLNLRNLDDIGELTELINQLLDQFHGVVKTIGTSAEQTRQGASAIARVLSEAEKVSQRSAEAFRGLKADLEDQAAESRKLTSVLESFRANLREVDASAETQTRFVTETSAAMEEMASSIQSVETITERSGKLTEGLSQQGLAGGSVVRETSDAIKEIEAAAKKVLEVLGALNKIAADINLLAMNAAIEAAHAGEQGLGFAVVADEVRKLSTTAAGQTKNIKELIKTMGERVGRGVERSQTSGRVLEGLVKGLQDAASLSGEIAGAMAEQSQGTRSVADSLVQVVDSSRNIKEKMAEQTVQTEKMTASLNQAFERLEALAESSRRQTESVRALEDSFAAVRKEVDSNLEAVGVLTQEIGRFQV